LDKYEVAAMWLYHEDYAAAAVGAVKFWERLGTYRRNRVVEMVDEILAAPFGTYGGSRRHTESEPPHV
jgi:hypothetical protein